MKESLKIIEQYLNLIPTGYVKTNDFKILPSTKVNMMKQSIETLIHHFKMYL